MLRISTVILSICLMVIFCSNVETIAPDLENTDGFITVSITIGKVGSLSKIGRKSDISFSRLCIKITSPKKPPVEDTVILPGGHDEFNDTLYYNLASNRTWVLEAHSLDSRDSVIHTGSTSFFVHPKDTDAVILELDSRFPAHLLENPGS